MGPDWLRSFFSGKYHHYFFLIALFSILLNQSSIPRCEGTSPLIIQGDVAKEEDCRRFPHCCLSPSNPFFTVLCHPWKIFFDFFKRISGLTFLLSFSSLCRIVAQTVEKFGRLDVLVISFKILMISLQLLYRR